MAPALATIERENTDMRYLHTMVRVRDLEESLEFYCNKLGLFEVRRLENEGGRVTQVLRAAAKHGAGGPQEPPEPPETPPEAPDEKSD